MGLAANCAGAAGVSGGMMANSSGWYMGGFLLEGCPQISQMGAEKSGWGRSRPSPNPA